MQLRHAQNEGVPGEVRVGLHQWAFDIDIKQNISSKCERKLYDEV